MYHFGNNQIHTIYNSSYQQCSMMSPSVSRLPANSIRNKDCEIGGNIATPNIVSIQSEDPLSDKQTEGKSVKPKTPKSKAKKKCVYKKLIDTSNFTIEERLVAAVWIHERKHTMTNISQIKRDFCQRFGRDPPSKTTLLVWERKLFATGSVSDAPRSGRPANRKTQVDQVAASVDTQPSLSLRARAKALLMPRTTLWTIMNKDLTRQATESDSKSSKPQKTKKAKLQSEKQEKKKSMKALQAIKGAAAPSLQPADVSARYGPVPPAPGFHVPTHHYMMPGQNINTHGYA